MPEQIEELAAPLVVKRPPPADEMAYDRDALCCGVPSGAEHTDACKQRARERHPGRQCIYA